MAEDYNSLKERFEGIRDERGLQRNTATRIGRAFLDLLDYLRSNVDGKFISKINNDTANGVITFVSGLVSNAIAWFKQGIKIGSDANSPLGIDANGNATLNNVTAAQLIASVLKTPGFAEAVGLAGKGFGVTAGQDGRATLQTDDLIVLGRMLVNSLNVREVTYIGGVYLLTPAGSTVAAVQQLYAEDGSESDTRAWSTDSSGMTDPVVVGYRLYWLADNGTTATMNFWQQGDQAYCQTFNIEAGVHENVSNSLWWRLVVGVGTDDSDPLGDGKDYHYADVADTDIVLLFDSEGEPVTGDGGSLSFIGKGSSYAYVSNGLTDYTVPTVGDKAVCLGSQISSNRRGAIQLNTEGVASIGIYDGINNYAPLSTHEVHFFSKDAVRMSSRRFSWTTATGASTPPVIYRGDWTQGSTSYYYDEWDYQGSRWLCLYQGAEGTTEEPGITPANWKEISLKGDDGTGYKLLPNPNIIKTKQTGESTYDPATASLTCGYVKNVGGKITSVADATAVIDNRYAIYFRRKSRGGGYESKYWFYTNSKARAFLSSLSLSDYDAVEFYLAENSLTPSLDVLARATFLNSLSGVIDNIIVPVVADGEDGTDGTSPIVADLDNEMDSVACDADGHPASLQEVSTKVSLYKGSTPIAINSIAVKDASGSTEASMTSGSALNGVTPTFTADPNSDTAQSISFSFATGSGTSFVNDKRVFHIIIGNSTENVSRDLYFTVNGVRPGADGEPATLYNIIPSPNDIAFSRLASGGLTPDKQYLTFTVKKTVGDSITELLSGQMYNSDKLKLKYSTSAPPSSDYSDGTEWGSVEQGSKISFSYGTATIPNDVAFSCLYLALFKEVTENGNASYVLHDRESVPVIKDGKDGKDGTDGDTIRTVTVYKQSDTQPATPTGDTIPPSGWSVTPGYFANGVIPGDGDNDIFVAHTISFVTTKANQKIKVRLESETEEDYDFVICGSVDETLDENELNAENLSQDDELRESYNAISGNDYNTIVLVVPNAGSHFIQVAYTKDRSQSATGDCGRYWVGFFDMPIWASIATFNGNTKVDGWSTPARWNGQDGNDGKDGEDAYLIVANPQYAIFEERLDGSNKVVDTSGFSGTLQVLKGGSAAQFKITAVQTSNCSNNGTESSNTAISSATVAFQNITSGASSGYLQFTVSTVDGKFQGTIKVPFYVNLLATWEREVIDGTEEVVASKMGFTDNGSTVTQLSWIGNYIRGWAENTSRLTETVGSTNYGNNLFGFSKGAVFDGTIPFVQGYGMACVWNNNQAYSRVWNLDFGGKVGTYVVTCEIKAQSEANIRFFLADIPPEKGSGLIKVGDELKVAVTTQWKKIVAVYNLTAADVANSNGQLVIRDGSTSNYVFIRYLQIERGSVPSAFGICAEDAANNSEPMHVTWNQSPSGGMFSDETSGNYGPGGTSKYTTNRVYPSRSPQYPEGTGYIELIKGDLVMTEGIYTLSFWARASVNESVMECFCYDATNTETYKGVLAYCDGLGMEYGEIDPNQTEGMSYWGSTRIKLTTAWKKYYVHWYMTGASSKIHVIPIRINGADTGGDSIDYYIAQIKLERGYVTSANRTVYETVMKQTARRMDFSVLVNSMEKAGIHLYTESNGTPDNETELAKGIIDLAAGKVNFVDPNGDPYQNPKVSIDPSTGALHAVDGEFSGTMTAAGGSMYFGKDGSWTGMATPSTVGDAVSIGVVKFNNGASYMGKVSLRGNGTYGGYIDMFAGGESTGSTLKMSHSVPLVTERSKIVLASGDNNSEASLTIQQSSASGASTVIEPDKITTTTVEANYILAKAGYKIQTADILTVSSQPSGSISASYQMIIVNTGSDITLTLSSTGASAGQLMIIKKTAENGWVTVKNSGGTQIGKFNSGSLVCVYNSGWQ